MDFMEKLILVLHPFVPFITKEIWQTIKEREPGDSIMISQAPKAGFIDDDLLERFDRVKDVIVFIRSLRAEKNLTPKELLRLQVRPVEGDYPGTFNPILKKLANLESIEEVDKQPEDAASQVVKAVEFYVLLEGLIDPEEEKKKILKELEYVKGFLAGVDKKLSNKRFVDNAPTAVVEKEQQKRADAEANIKALEAQLKN